MTTKAWWWQVAPTLIVGVAQAFVLIFVMLPRDTMDIVGRYSKNYTDSQCILTRTQRRRMRKEAGSSTGFRGQRVEMPPPPALTPTPPPFLLLPTPLGWLLEPLPPSADPTIIRPLRARPHERQMRREFSPRLAPYRCWTLVHPYVLESVSIPSTIRSKKY